jgi:hypothetical protein
LMTTPPCLRHSFTQHVIATHPAGLGSELVLQKLACVACLARLDIANVEIGHGRLRRRVLQSSNNTWKTMIDVASAGWVIQEFARRRREVALLAGLKMPPPVARTARPAQASAPNGPPDNVEQKPKRRSDGKQTAGGGGAYRAFLRKEGLNMFDGTAVLRYRALSAPDRADLLPDADMLRGAQRVRVEQHIPRMGDQRKVERAAKRARNSAILDQKVKALHDGSCDVLVEFDGSLARGDPLACYKHARQDLAADRKANRLVESKMVEHLQEYRELHTSQVIDQLLPIVGEQHPFQRDDLSSAPTSLDHFDCVHVFPDVQAMATKLLSYAMGSHHKFRFFLDYLEMDWSRKHQTIMHNQSPPITQPSDTGSLCSKAHYCICSERGKLVKQLVARWSLAFKGSIVKFSGKPLVWQVNGFWGL